MILQTFEKIVGFRTIHPTDIQCLLIKLSECLLAVSGFFLYLPITIVLICSHHQWPFSVFLLPKWPGFDSQTRCHICVEFVDSLLCTERFFSVYSHWFSLSLKTFNLI